MYYALNYALPTAQMILVIVFVLAGVTKLVDRTGILQAIVDFGFPRTLAQPFSILLPIIELTVAIILIPRYTVIWGGISAIVLLMLFNIVIAINLAKGYTPDCHCFGQVQSKPISWHTLVRNGILALLALFIVWRVREHPEMNITNIVLQWTPFDVVKFAVELILFGFIIIEGWFLMHVLRQNGRLLARVESIEQSLTNVIQPVTREIGRPTKLEIGASAPVINLPGLDGNLRTLDDLHNGKPIMLLFIDYQCGPCNALMPELAHWQQAYSDKLIVVPIGRGSITANLEFSRRYKIKNMLLQEKYEVALQFGANLMPSAVIIQPEGTIGSEVALGTDAIRSHLAKVVNHVTVEPLLDAFS